MTEASNDVRILNSLIATLLDSIDGYEESAGEIENEAIASKFLESARERQDVVADLQAAVASAGGKPEDHGTILAVAHRTFLDLKQAIAGKNEQAIVKEIERGEDHLKVKFDEAMGDATLSSNARAAIEKAWQSVRADHHKTAA